MQQISIRDWTESVPWAHPIEDGATGAAFSVDAMVGFIDQQRATIVGNEPVVSVGLCEVDWQNDLVRGKVSAQRLAQDLFVFDCELRVTRDFVSTGIGWSFQLQAQAVSVLSGNYRMGPLVHPQRQNGLTPLALQAQAGGRFVGLLSPDSTVGHDWHPAGPEQVIGTIWFDHPLAHPRFTFDGPQFRNWHNGYRYRAGTVLRRQLYAIVTDRPTPLLVLGRYPGRHRAVFSITDHADHDSCERLAALWYGSSRDASTGPRRSKPAGFVDLALPFTKSVFTATPQPDGPGLHYRPFAELCRQGHRAGIEICPHGVHSTLQPAVSELEGLLGPFDEFRPLTWIDHGNHFLSNYGRRGWNPDDEFTLLPWLDRLGIKYVWGRIDFGQSLPRAHLDQVAIDRFCGWSYLRDIPRHAARSLAAGRPWAALHGFSSVAFQLIPEPTMRQYFLAQRKIQRVMKADVLAVPGAVWQSGKMLAALAAPPGFTELCHHLSGVREELSRTPIFFPEHHAIYCGRDDRWLFNTIAVHDVAQAYSPAVVEQLLTDYGIHLSHTYLTSTSRAHVSHAIQPDGPHHWRLTAAFAENLRHLAKLRDTGRLWVASMGEIGEFWRQRSQIRLLPRGAGTWQLSMPSEGDGKHELELQLVVIGPIRECRGEGQCLELEPLHDDLQFSTLRAPSGKTVDLECRA